jgi:hypothetical protein
LQENTPGERRGTLAKTGLYSVAPRNCHGSNKRVGIARGLCVKQKLNSLNLKCIGFKCGVSNGLPCSNGVPSTWLQRVVVQEVMKLSSPKPISLFGSTSSIKTHVVCVCLWYVFYVV